ncbi:RNA 2',3'-cyclic phosphodiesterase [Candidatus Babeliales bacterium]|nr:RNA 2',3'-cyclic phosphodiesterase [Candidatus Babeliales bacterium]
MRKRLFVAILLDDKTKEKLENYKNNLNLNQKNNIQWIPKENLHITIYFLESIEEKLIPEIINKINQVISKTKPFSLKFEKIILAPPKKEPHMIWAQFEKNKNYDQLFFDLNNFLQKFLIKKTQINYKENIPHVTMARFKNKTKINDNDIKQINLPDLNINCINLMESQLNVNGAIYSTINTFF